MSWNQGVDLVSEEELALPGEKRPPTVGEVVDVCAMLLSNSELGKNLPQIMENLQKQPLIKEADKFKHFRTLIKVFVVEIVRSSFDHAIDTNELADILSMRIAGKEGAFGTPHGALASVMSDHRLADPKFREMRWSSFVGLVEGS